MYRKYRISLFACLALISLILLKSCTEDVQVKTDANTSIPELLQRGAKIQYDKEWEEVQNNYAYFKKTLSKSPNDAETKLKLAQLFIREARVTGEHGHYYPAALQVLDQVLNQDSLTRDFEFLALMNKAGVQLSLHDFQQAKETGDRALLINPANAQIYGVLVDANVELGNYSDAILLADKMISMKPDIRSYSRVAYLREIHGDIPGSIEALTMAIKAGYPGTEETAWAMQTLGELYLRYDETEKAERIFNNILEMRKDYPFAVGGLADVMVDKNNLKEAEKTYNRGIEIIPEVGFYVSLAEIYKAQDRKEKLNKVLPEIYVMLEDDEKSGHNMNLEYVHIYRDIVEDYDKALEYGLEEYNKRPNNIDVNLALAEVYQKMDNTLKVAEHIEKAGITNSKNPTLLALQQ